MLVNFTSTIRNILSVCLGGVLVILMGLFQPASAQENEAEQAAISASLGKAALASGDYGDAQKYLKRALDISKKQGLEKTKADAFYGLGLIAKKYGDYKRSYSYLTQAYETYNWKVSKSEAEGEVASLFGDLGNVAVLSGDSWLAKYWFETAVAFCHSRGYVMREVKALDMLGRTSLDIGDYRNANLYFERALEIYRSLDMADKVASIFNHLGFLAIAMGNYQSAQSYLNQASSAYDKFSLTEDGANACLALGRMALDMGEYQSARDYFERARQVYHTLGLKHEATTSQGSIADTYVEQGDIQTALNLYQRIPDYISAQRARCYFMMGDIQIARVLFLKILYSYEARISADVLIASLIGTGLSDELLAKKTEALRLYQIAVQQIEKQREYLPPGEYGQFLARTVMGFRRIDAYEGLVRALYRLDKPDDAFYQSEHTKARVLIETIARTSSQAFLSLPQSQRIQEQTLINRIASNRKRTDKAAEEGDRELHSRLVKELTQLKREQQAWLSQLRSDYPEYASTMYPQPLKASELVLKPDEVLIEFEVTEPMTLVFVVRGGKVIHSYSVKMTRKQLEQKVGQYRKSLETIAKTGLRSGWSDFNVPLAYSLYHDLLEPALKQVKPDEKILVVPDEVLCLLPMEALVTQMPAGKLEWEDKGKGLYPKGVRYVGDNRVLTYWQSASALTVTRRLRKHIPNNSKVLVVADPIYNTNDTRLAQGEKSRWKSDKRLVAMRGIEIEVVRRVLTDEQNAIVKHQGWQRVNRLEDTGQFAEDLQKRYGDDVTIWTGADACESRPLVKPLDQYGLAVLYATHGIVDERTPYLRQAALLLSNPSVIGEPLKVKIGEAGSEYVIDGYQTMSEIMGQRYLTEVVGALACSTGEGGQVAGEGVMNLGRAFQYAGARSVLVSLWSVEGSSTNKLTEWFLEGLKADKSKDEALLEARRRLREAGYEHPFYWAAFELIGERDVVNKEVPQKPYSRLAIMLVSGMSCMILGIVIMGIRAVRGKRLLKSRSRHL